MSNEAQEALTLGAEVRLGWICPRCEKVLWKPPTLHEGQRYHSFRCQVPMVRCRVQRLGGVS